jgi:hypothetical protein
MKRVGDLTQSKVRLNEKDRSLVLSVLSNPPLCTIYGRPILNQCSLDTHSAVWHPLASPPVANLIQALSSVVEHYLDTVGVSSSTLLVPTISISFYPVLRTPFASIPLFLVGSKRNN